MVQKQKIILKHRGGESNRRIAEELGIDKNTVNKYVNEYEKQLADLLAKNPEADPDELLPGIVEKPKYNVDNRDVRDTTKEAMVIIQECLDENAKKREDGRYKQQMKKIDIHDYLKKKGYRISYSTVKRIVRKLEEEHKEAFIKQVYAPGVQTEFDWGEVKLDIGGTGYKKYQMAVFTSSYGNHRYAKLFRVQDTACFQASHADYFAFCKGVYHTVVYDNMRVAVKKFVGPSEKEPTEALLQLSAYYGFAFRFCNIKRGNEKGHVERSVDVVRRFAFSRPGEDCFESLEAANEHLLKKCKEKNGEELSDGRIADDCFAEERAFLMPSMPKMPCYAKRTDLKVDKYSTVTVNKVHYSVPDTNVGRKLSARVYTDKVEIYKGDEKIASHERHYKNGEYVLDIFHYLRTLKRKPGALPQSSALMQSDAQIKKLYEDHYSKDPKEFLEVLALIEEIGVGPVVRATKTLLMKSTGDLSAAKLRLVHDNLCEMDESDGNSTYGEDRLSRRSKESLRKYNELMDIQARRAG